MYESHWDKEKKQPRSKNIESFGYVSDLISDEIPDPVSYYQKYVEKKNREHEESFRITKSYLDARPVYVQKKETIYGHFLICYPSACRPWLRRHSALLEV